MYIFTYICNYKKIENNIFFCLKYVQCCLSCLLPSHYLCFIFPSPSQSKSPPDSVVPFFYSQGLCLDFPLSRALSLLIPHGFFFLTFLIFEVISISKQVELRFKNKKESVAFFFWVCVCVTMLSIIFSKSIPPFACGVYGLIFLYNLVCDGQNKNHPHRFIHLNTQGVALFV